LAVNAAQAVQRYSNLYMQTCATTLLALRRAVRLVGPQKILFGSDGGFGNPRWIDYTLRKIRKWGLPATAEAMVLGENAVRLMKQSRPP
ncbi:MAG: amidohydrolase family protein, partial [bacterium]|nr:amidohydrolase family protein [bacterium]